MHYLAHIARTPTPTVVGQARKAPSPTVVGQARKLPRTMKMKQDGPTTVPRAIAGAKNIAPAVADPYVMLLCVRRMQRRLKELRDHWRL